MRPLKLLWTRSRAHSGHDCGTDEALTRGPEDTEIPHHSIVSAWSVVGVNLPRGQPGPPWSSPRTNTGWTRAVKKPVGPVRSRLVS
ncbi:hypothetical protein CROQUDRAFT_96276 [Cronartium quercuum f. sp. fusiforme G11]|uniref:Uncharacterized protein n=1 Tax=Cronartium quercuum f. sp. fusiforme G11 TaxID=708437 RepID=A0A9P6NB89_9BASI|nr:hypothetical protein CROQUDRAFT_96276 [Cronartium quercuum f. sp. fusiforme G11]